MKVVQVPHDAAAPAVAGKLVFAVAAGPEAVSISPHLVPRESHSILGPVCHDDLAGLAVAPVVTVKVSAEGSALHVPAAHIEVLPSVVWVATG